MGVGRAGTAGVPGGCSVVTVTGRDRHLLQTVTGRDRHLLHSYADGKPGRPKGRLAIPAHGHTQRQKKVDSGIALLFGKFL